MKAGIVTIYDTGNFGNRLQNYALQQALLKYADQVLTLKNKIRYGNRLGDLIRASSLVESEFVNGLQGKARKVRFLQFSRQFIRLSKKCYWYNDKEVSLKKGDVCDVYCVGSDQVWNPFLDRDAMFNFAGFADRDAVFSYAASFGIEQIPEGRKEKLRRGLEHVKYISVREKSGQRIVEELTGRTDVQVVVDPTMLLTAEEWEQVMEQPASDLPERYLLTYFLGDVSEERRAEVRRVAQRQDCRIVDLMDPEGAFHNIGPGEFLYLIRNARMVCTDSFHGSVFTFLLQQPLAIFFREGDSDMSGRIWTLVETFHLEGRLAHENRVPESALSGDYSAGYEALRAEREKAFAFFDRVFSKAASPV